jgi:hypothetical protein
VEIHDGCDFVGRVALLFVIVEDLDATHKVAMLKLLEAGDLTQATEVDALTAVVGLLVDLDGHHFGIQGPVGQEDLVEDAAGRLGGGLAEEDLAVGSLAQPTDLPVLAVEHVGRQTVHRINIAELEHCKEVSRPLSRQPKATRYSILL